MEADLRREQGASGFARSRGVPAVRTWASLTAIFRSLASETHIGLELEGSIEVRVSKPLSRAICVDSVVRDLPGDQTLEVLSTYVGSPVEPRWRVIHLELDLGGAAGDGNGGSRVRSYRSLEGAPGVRLCVLDHLQEVQQILARRLVSDVAIDLA